MEIGDDTSDSNHGAVSHCVSLETFPMISK